MAFLTKEPRNGYYANFDVSEYVDSELSQRITMEKYDINLSLYSDQETLIDCFVSLLIALDFQVESIQRALESKAFDLKTKGVQ